MRFDVLTAAMLVSVLGAGCFPTLHGAKASDQNYWVRNDAPVRTAPKCTRVSDGTSSDGPTTVYFVVQDEGRTALDLAEPDAVETETLIANRWSASDGDHYFDWQGNTGWEWVIPAGAQGGVRRVYENVETATEAGVTKPTSAITVNCPLQPYAKH